MENRRDLPDYRQMTGAKVVCNDGPVYSYSAKELEKFLRFLLFEKGWFHMGFKEHADIIQIMLEKGYEKIYVMVNLQKDYVWIEEAD